MIISPERAEAIDEKYELYSNLPEWNWLHDVLLKIDRECSPWMHAKQVTYLKKQLFVQIVERVPCEDDEVSYTSLD